MSSPTSTTTPPATTRTLSPLAPGLLASILTPTTPFTPDADRLFASPKLTLYMIPASLTNDEACIVITDTDGKDTPHYAVNPVSLSWFCRKIEAMRKINSTDKLKITDAMVSFAESFLVILTEHTRRNWSAEQIEKANRLRALPELPPVPREIDVRERTADDWSDWIARETGVKKVHDDSEGEAVADTVAELTPESPAESPKTIVSNTKPAKRGRKPAKNAPKTNDLLSGYTEG